MTDHGAERTGVGEREGGTPPGNDGGERATVLVVEDDEDIATLYTAWLADYAVEAVTSGERALEVVDEGTDVVVLDRQLPGRSGEDVLETLRERGFACQVVVASGVEPGFDLVRMEFDAYLVKPVTRDELRTTVCHALTRADYDEKLREFYALSETRGVLRERMTDEELAASEEYAALEERCRELTEQLDTIAGAIEETRHGGEDGASGDGGG